MLSRNLSSTLLRRARALRFWFGGWLVMVGRGTWVIVGCVSSPESYVTVKSWVDCVFSVRF